MRREWSAWIRNRQWSEFETLAKKDPSQPLADTVAELERGFDEKSDRRALRKILFLLRQKGYVPQPIEEAEQEDVALSEPVATPDFATMISPGIGGETTFIHVRTTSKGSRVMVAGVHAVRGLVSADETDVAPENLELVLQRLVPAQDHQSPSISVDPDYALARISTALRKEPTLQSVTAARWRATLPVVEEPPHPAETLARTPVEGPDLSRAFYEVHAFDLWRLEFGATSGYMETLSTLEGDTTLEEAEKNARSAEAQAISLQQCFDDRGVRDFEGRLLDVAYALAQRNDPHVGVVLGFLDDLRARGPASDFAKLILHKTCYLFIERLRREAEARAEQARRGA